MKIEKSAPPPTVPPSATGKDKAFWALDWLRFVLGAYIVLFHTLRTNYSPNGPTWLDAALGLGNMATSIFFVLSGFLLTHAYVVTKNGRDINRRNFLIARFSTLYPLHVAGLLLALVPMAITIVSKGGVSVATEVYGPAERMLGHLEFAGALVVNVLLLNAWNPYYMSFNYPSWSLSALGFFYLVFPVIALRIYRAKSPMLLIVVMGLLFIAPGVIADLLERTDVFTDGLMHRNPILRLPLFVAGIALSVLFARSPASGPAARGVLAAVVLATVAFGIYLQYVDNHSHIIRNGLYFPASLAVIWLCVWARPIHNPGLRYWGARLGAASLPLFLLHAPLFVLFRRLEKLVLAVAYSPDWRLSSIMATGKQVEPTLGFYIVYLTVLIFLCVIVQERLVLPLQARIRNYMGPAAPAADERKQGTGTS